MQNILKTSLVLALIVVALGAWTRLSDAGLGCPDWPTCYGQIIVPDTNETKINGYTRELEPYKAWMEMIHRYAASILGLLSIIIVIFSFKPNYTHLKSLSFGLLGIVLFQGALGAWTVTELVHPLIVTSHLLGGFITTSIIFLLITKLNNKPKISVFKLHKKLISITIAVLFIQIFLGGWVSTNYAALSCGDFFPSCLGSYIHSINFGEIFFVGELGVNYEFGVLSAENRAAIQILHRIGALITLIVVLITIFKLKQYYSLRNNLKIITILLITQIILGILNIYLSLPIVIATAHNVVALLLLLSLFNLQYKTKNDL